MLNKEVLVTEENIDLIMGGWMTKYYLIAQKNLNKVKREVVRGKLSRE